jgi:L-alanine-DL-glutamate epimerase-like enolase superfamily enzyme
MIGAAVISRLADLQVCGIMKSPIQLSMSAKIERWPLAHAFTISRGSKTEAVVVSVEISDGTHTGRGECVPYARYGETPETVLTRLETLKDMVARGMGREELQTVLPAGASRNVLDCAFWDLEAKQSGRPAFELAGLPAPRRLTTAWTLSLDTPEAMANAASLYRDWPLLKIKLGGEGDPLRLRAIRAAVPDAELIVDANEAWSEANLVQNLDACASVGVTMVEQPLPAGKDDPLALISHTVPICADESLHDRATLKKLVGKYEAVNIKLDKAGGLTEALALLEQAEGMGFSIMAGCMVATSLAIAPALLFAQKAKVVDLDGPLWLEKDRPHGLRYDKYSISPAERALWG